nr:putative disease resistance RPP13-like protein 1 isoform X2 [Quercus suber]
MAVFLGQALATSIIQVALDRLASHEVIDYFKGRKLNQKLLQNLEFVLLSANSVLIDAEEKQFTNSAVKKWLDELKDAVYVADDLLDEIATEALRSKSEAKLQTRTKKCHFLLSITSDTPTINFMPLVRHWGSSKLVLLQYLLIAVETHSTSGPQTLILSFGKFW